MFIQYIKLRGTFRHNEKRYKTENIYRYFNEFLCFISVKSIISGTFFALGFIVPSGLIVANIEIENKK